MKITFKETITADILYKRVLRKILNTPIAGIIFMMYLFSVGNFVLDVYHTGAEAFSSDKWVLLIMLLIPLVFWNAFNTVRKKIYEQLPKGEELEVEYEISTWYIGINDWEEREIKWNEVYRFEETKKSFEVYLNPTQSITIEKSAMTPEDHIALRDLARMKLNKRKLKNLK